MTIEELVDIICIERPPAFHVRTENRGTTDEVYIYQSITSVGMVQFGIPCTEPNTQHLQVRERSHMLVKYLEYATE